MKKALIIILFYLLLSTGCASKITRATISCDYPPFSEYELTYYEAKRVLEFLDTVDLNKYDRSPNNLVGDGYNINIEISNGDMYSLYCLGKNIGIGDGLYIIDDFPLKDIIEKYYGHMS